MELIGVRIRKRRKELGLTQGEVAKRSGLGTGTISDLEHGRQRETTKPLAVAQALGVRVEWLTSGSGEMLPNANQDREPPPSYITERHTRHEVLVSREGAELGAEWDKIEGDEYRQLARDFIYGLVAAQKRAARRRPETAPTTRAKTPKNKPRPPILE